MPAKITRVIIAAASIVMAVSIAFGAPDDAVAAGVIAEQTPVTVVLDAELKSGDAKEGADVPFHTTTILYTTSHTVAIPAGAKCWGVVRKSQGHGAWGKSGKLDFSCDYIEGPGGVKVPLRSQSMAVKGKDNTGALVGGIVLLGVFGGFVKGRDVTIHEGTPFTMYVDADTTVSGTAASAEKSDLKTVSSKDNTVPPAGAPPATGYGAIIGRKIGTGS